MDKVLTIYIESDDSTAESEIAMQYVIDAIATSIKGVLPTTIENRIDTGSDTMTAVLEVVPRPLSANQFLHVGQKFSANGCSVKIIAANEKRFTAEVSGPGWVDKLAVGTCLRKYGEAFLMVEALNLRTCRIELVPVEFTPTTFQSDMFAEPSSDELDRQFWEIIDSAVDEEGTEGD